MRAEALHLLPYPPGRPLQTSRGKPPPRRPTRQRLRRRYPPRQREERQMERKETLLLPTHPDRPPSRDLIQTPVSGLPQGRGRSKVPPRVAPPPRPALAQCQPCRGGLTATPTLLPLQREV